VAGFVEARKIITQAEPKVKKKIVRKMHKNKTSHNAHFVQNGNGKTAVFLKKVLDKWLGLWYY
jgi:hypothetical protein